jgi:hypothetical protein
MRIREAAAVAGLICGLSVLGSQSQGPPHPAGTSKPVVPVVEDVAENSSERDDALTLDDRLSLIAAALDSHVRRNSEADCSHLVHAIYQEAGFHYQYAPSKDLYAGVDGFDRVKTPEPGDLVVWRGHAGIVIKPSQHLFFSFLTSGPGIDDYQSPYWKHRGKPRFYRYIKDFSCSECEPAKTHSRRLLKVKR